MGSFIFSDDGMSFRSLSEIMAGGVPCDAVERVQEHYRLERQRNLIDLIVLRAAQDLSYLNGQVVGAEVPAAY